MPKEQLPSPTEKPARGAGLHKISKASEKHAKTLLARKEDHPCMVHGCPERSRVPLGYCKAHGEMATRGLILDRRAVTASERLWLMASAFRVLLNQVQAEEKGVEEAAIRLWDLAHYHLLTDAPFHDLHSNLPFSAFLEARSEEYTWAGVIQELRSHLPFSLDRWESRNTSDLVLSIALDRTRERLLGKSRQDVIRELSLFFQQKKSVGVEIRVSIHLPMIGKRKPLTKPDVSDYYPNDLTKEKPAWQQSPTPPRNPEKP